MNEKETICISKQKIVELVKLLDETKQILRGAPTPQKSVQPQNSARAKPRGKGRGAGRVKGFDQTSQG